MKHLKSPIATGFSSGHKEFSNKCTFCLDEMLPNGSVFMEIQGTEEQIDRVFAMVSQGTYVNIEKMDAKSIPVVEDERGFHTRESLGDFWGLWHR